MKSVKLIDFKEDIVRGTVIRCKGIYPYEDYVDFMVVEFTYSTTRRYGLFVISGYKAGLVNVIFPSEAYFKANDGYVITSNWLTSNWSKWGYIDCPLEAVYILPSKKPWEEME